MTLKSIEQNRCDYCHEFHDVEDERRVSGSGHDALQAQTIWLCDNKRFPDDEAFNNR